MPFVNEVLCDVPCGSVDHLIEECGSALSLSLSVSLSPPSPCSYGFVTFSTEEEAANVHAMVSEFEFSVARYLQFLNTHVVYPKSIKFNIHVFNDA